MADQGGGSSLMRDYRKGNWTVSETMVLIEAKRMDDERRMKRSNESEGRGKPTELRWKWVEDYCWRKGCLRSQNQCNDKWDNLMRDYKKVRDYERRVAEKGGGGGGGGEGSGSYWKLEKSERKERNLPSNMLFQIYEALVEVVERRGGGGAASGSSSGLAMVGVTGSTSNPNLISYHVVERPSPSSRVQVSMPPLLQHHQQVSSSTTTNTPPPSQVLPLPPPPPPPPIPPSHPPPEHVSCAIPRYHPSPAVDSEDTSDDEYSGSPAKRRRRGNGGGAGGGGEGTSTGGGGGGTDDDHHQVGNAISKSASIIAEAIHACEEREERRHRDLVALHERRLRIEESKTEISKQGINGLVEAINNLATSILALASHNKNNQPTS